MPMANELVCAELLGGCTYGIANLCCVAADDLFVDTGG
jgi:hypothetical protein